MIMSALYLSYTLSWIFFNSNSLLKQQSAGRHVAPLGHIILIQSQSFFVLTPKWYQLCGEAANTGVVIFGLTRPWLKSTIYQLAQSWHIIESYEWTEKWEWQVVEESERGGASFMCRVDSLGEGGSMFSQLLSKKRGTLV